MKLSECISLAATMVDPGGTDVLDDNKELFITCANNCLDEIVSEYLPFKQEAVVTSTDGKIPYSLLGEKVYDITSVRKNGMDIKFEMMPSYIKVGHDGEYKIKFNSGVLPLKENDELPDIPRLTARIMAYGVAAEYLLINGFYDEAVTYDVRFKDALKRASFGGSEKRIKKRRWLI